MSRMPRFRRRQVRTSLRSSAVQRSELCTFLALLPRFALLFFFGRANHSIRGLSTLLKASQQRPAGAVEFDASCYAGMRQPARRVLPPPPSHMPVDRRAMAFIHSVGRASRREPGFNIRAATENSQSGVHDRDAHFGLGVNADEGPTLKRCRDSERSQAGV